MKTLMLTDGDLVVTPTGHQTVSGSAKIRQEMGAALIEPYGLDRFHRDYGSTVRNQIGEVFDAETEMLIQSEVNRVVQSYVVTQRNEVLQDNLQQRASRFDATDVVRSVQRIDLVRSYDAIVITVTFITLAGESVSLTSTLEA